MSSVDGENVQFSNEFKLVFTQSENVVAKRNRIDLQSSNRLSFSEFFRELFSIQPFESKDYFFYYIEDILET